MSGSYLGQPGRCPASSAFLCVRPLHCVKKAVATASGAYRRVRSTARKNAAHRR
jgi:hypothetical protein